MFEWNNRSLFQQCILNTSTKVLFNDLVDKQLNKIPYNYYTSHSRFIAPSIPFKNLDCVVFHNQLCSLVSKSSGRNILYLININCNTYDLLETVRVHQPESEMVCCLVNEEGIGQ